MRKRVLSIFLLGSVIGTSLVASDYRNGDCQYQQDGHHKMMMEGKRNSNRGMHSSIFGAIHQLDLSKEQMDKIRDIMQNSKPKFESYAKAFEGNKFNKNAYINISMNKYKNMVEFKATLIEKIYTVLTDKQKTELKELIKNRPNEPRKGMRNDKHCNGGR